jgi:DNA-nicking Smr family endonuclease
MDAKTFKKMKAGKKDWDAKLDLHGLTLAQAQPRLTRFVLGAYEDGARLLLVVTGKGRDRDAPGPMPARRGALRHQVPAWLRMPPLAPVVLQVAQAHRSHGGEGAYYVYLRR